MDRSLGSAASKTDRRPSGDPKVTEFPAISISIDFSESLAYTQPESEYLSEKLGLF
jgi:hypothetical protein